MSKPLSGTIDIPSAGTAVQGPSNPSASGRKKLTFVVKANDGNTGAVYIGNDGAGDVTAANGFPLNSGESVEVHVNGLDEFYFDADTSGNDIQWLVKEG